MPVDCQRSTSGGKGNLNMFIERDPHICAAGLPTAQPDEVVADSLQHYLLKDEVDALLSDTIMPPKKPLPLPPLRHPIPLDMRYAGPFGNVAKILNPPIKTKFQTLVDDFKDTPYTSYWKKPLGRSSDPVPMLPEGFDIEGTTFGKKTEFHGRLYDIVMPKEPQIDNTSKSKDPGVQKEYNYCAPPFNNDLTYGHRTFVDKRGTYAKCCVTDDRMILGTSSRTIVNTIQANFQDIYQPRIGVVLSPNQNINNLPEGYSFGKLKPPDNLPECLTFCELNPGREPSPEIPKIEDVPSDCLDFRTTYTEMVKPDKEQDKSLMAGLPSGRYFDQDFPVTPERCCKADRSCFPHESDMKACLCPSVFTLLHVNHRDMYGKRDPDVIRQVFEAVGEQFDDEKFNNVWEEAKKYHSQGWVCYETFRRALENYDNSEEKKK
ncbi:unnamed protein product [Danaus chrysippus]|uniref:(African queen) hypothetical protein n=2 Tax=Danaus chrysippus TaxID=151541 RepID=A0A8J2W1N5_9NEOP|nr:unnamed protein product [Danaus chrysippus]